MAHTKTRNLIVGTALLALLAALVLAIALNRDDGSATGSQSTVRDSRGGVADILATLDRPRGASDVLSEDDAAAVTADATHDAQPQLSRRVATQGRWTVYLVPAGSSVCTLMRADGLGASVRCYDQAELESGAAVGDSVLTGCDPPQPGAEPPCERATFWGVVPDGVEEVSVSMRDGAPVTAEVDENSYIVDVPLEDGPNAIYFEGADGKVVRPVPLDG